MQQFTKAVDTLSERIMTEKESDKMNMYMSTLKDIASNTCRYTDWILTHVDKN